MKKRQRPWLINVGITAVVIIASFFIMGAYDQSCDGTIKYAELNYDFNNFSGFDTSIGSSGETVVNIEQGTAASIPLKVVLTMQNDFTLDSVYGANTASQPSYTSAGISIYSTFSNLNISIGNTSSAITSGTATTTGATIMYTANLNLSDTLTEGDYEVPITFNIYNKIDSLTPPNGPHTFNLYESSTLNGTISIHVYDFEIATTSLPTGIAGQSYSETLMILGGTAPYAWDATGLPDGLSLNSSTGAISGIPAAEAHPTVSITVTDSSATPKTASANFDLDIYQEPLSITTDSLANGTVGSAYSDTLEASGGTAPYTWDATGLPDGLSLVSSTGAISGTPTTAGAFTVAVTVTDDVSDTSSDNLTITIGSASSGGGHSSRTDSKDPVVNGDKIQIKDIKVDQNTGIAQTQIKDNNILDNAFNNSVADDKGIKTVEITIPKTSGAQGYQSTLPADFWSTGEGEKAIEINTAVADVKLPDNMLRKTELSGAQDISLTVSAGDKTKLDSEAQAQIGDRPIIEISLSVDGKRMAWSNDSVPVIIAIPYKPTVEELKDPEHITIWYIDGSGKAVSVPSGKYDAKTGYVTFNTTHFSKYAVTFVQKIFKDLEHYSWAEKNIEVLASKGIISGSTETTFNPSGKITRADFLVLLTKTLGLNAKSDVNFSDVNSGAYYYEAVGTAKELGVVTGLENNTFNPKALISRQDMMVMTERALKIVKSDAGNSQTDNLNQYADKDMISEYAKESVSNLIRDGFVEGNNGKVNPRSNTTRAEAAVFLYNIYNAN